MVRDSILAGKRENFQKQNAPDKSLLPLYYIYNHHYIGYEEVTLYQNHPFCMPKSDRNVSSFQCMGAEIFHRQKVYSETFDKAYSKHFAIYFTQCPSFLFYPHCV